MIIRRLINKYKVLNLRKKFLSSANSGENVFLSLNFKFNIVDNSVNIGNNTYLDGLLYTRENGKISIGDHCSFRTNTFIGSLNSVIIGNHVFGADNVYICDNNNHPISPEKRLEMTFCPPNTDKWKWSNDLVVSSPIIIGDNVWLGRCSMILKGVTIGEGSIVAAGAVVTKSVPPYSIVAGNPAKVVKKIN